MNIVYIVIGIFVTALLALHISYWSFPYRWMRKLHKQFSFLQQRNPIEDIADFHALEKDELLYRYKEQQLAALRTFQSELFQLAQIMKFSQFNSYSQKISARLDLLKVGTNALILEIENC
ncbi:MAG: hypothetical protein JWL92_599 [Candidatus Nomurabacteria bacterium]|nr:hypothetical protein [Candidatus Nomurabacteria bacterium]